MAFTPVQKVQRYRARKKAGVAHVPITADQQKVVDALVQAGIILPGTVVTKSDIVEATNRLIKTIISEENSK